jgi:uncharacterized protein YeaO (DUF488 family)
MPFQIKRVYDSSRPSDGIRILVDRLWPRGVKKSDAHLAAWVKDVAPSAKLRQWFDHDPVKFAEFDRRYRAELADNAAIGELRKAGRGRTVTLLYAARDPAVNHALVLRSVLERGLTVRRRAAVRKPAGKKRTRKV